MGVWTDKKIEKLKELWKEGISTAEIGKRLDFSKNAIVGKVNRLGLEHRTSPIKSSAKSSKVQDAKNIEQSESSTKTQSRVSSTSKLDKKISDTVSSSKNNTVSPKNTTTDGVRLIDLTADRCCWPIDDVSGEGFHFCGKKVFKGKPYCLEHCVMAYTNSSTLKEKDKNEN